MASSYSYFLGKQLAIKHAADLWNPVNPHADDLMSGLKRQLRQPAAPAPQAPLRSAAGIRGVPFGMPSGAGLKAPLPQVGELASKVLPQAGAKPMMAGLGKVVSGAPQELGLLGRLFKGIR